MLAHPIGTPMNGLHLGNLVNVADAGGSSELRRVLLVLVQVRIDVLGNMGKRFGRVLGPEEIFGVEVI